MNRWKFKIIRLLEWITGVKGWMICPYCGGTLPKDEPAIERHFQWCEAEAVELKDVNEKEDLSRKDFWDGPL